MTDLQDAFAQRTELCLDGRLTREKIYPTEAGGYADVYEGLFEGRKVAIKVVRPFKLQRGKLLRRLWREFLTWSRLSHPNILVCLGYSYDFSPGTYILPSLISPWMENGTVISYIENHPEVDRINLLVGVARGLSYLHTQEPVIVHADVRAGNILVSDQGVPYLTDFGLSRILEEVHGMTTTSDLAGSVRWMSPELFQSDGKASVHSDIWAYGMTVLEVLSGRRPYSAVKSDLVVLGQVRDGKIPPRPQGEKGLEAFDDRVWVTCKRCWCLEPTARPSMQEVLSLITSPVKEALAEKTFLDEEVIPDEKEIPDQRGTLVVNKVHNMSSFCKPSLQGSNCTLGAGDRIHDRKVRINMEHILNNRHMIRCFNFSIDGKYLAVGSSHTIEIHDTRTGSKICILDSPTPGILLCLCFSPDGKLLATGDEKGKISIWTIKHKKVREMLNKHAAPVCALEFSNDGRFLVSAGGAGRKVRIWNMETYHHSVLHIGLKLTKYIWSRIVAFSPNGQLVAVARKQHIYLWDAWRRVVLEQLRVRGDMVTSVAFSPDGKGLANGTSRGDIQYWDLSPFLRSSRKNERLEPGIDVRRDSEKGSKCVAEVSYPEVRGEGMQDPLVLKRLQEGLRFVAVSKDGNMVISSSETGCVRFWNFRTGKSMTELQSGQGAIVSFQSGLTTGMIATVGETGYSTRLWSYDVGV